MFSSILRILVLRILSRMLRFCLIWRIMLRLSLSRMLRSSMWSNTPSKLKGFSAADLNAARMPPPLEGSLGKLLWGKLGKSYLRCHVELQKGFQKDRSWSSKRYLKTISKRSPKRNPKQPPKRPPKRPQMDLPGGTPSQDPPFKNDRKRHDFGIRFWGRFGGWFLGRFWRSFFILFWGRFGGFDVLKQFLGEHPE